jgi:general secretion pathway protein C
MPNIKDFFSRKKGGGEDTTKVVNSSDVTSISSPMSDSTVVGSRTSIFKTPNRFTSFKGGIPFEHSLPFVLVGSLALMAADLTGIAMRSNMLPTSAPPAKKQTLEQTNYKSLNDYNDILARNIFNSDGFIPDVQIAEGTAQLDVNTARETSLPLTLVGTIVHANPGKSVATIQVKGNAEKVLPYIPNDDIEGMATLIKVDRKKVFIRNLSGGALEYIQIKDDTAFAFKTKVPGFVQDGPISKEGDNTFAISRSDLEAQMANLPELLTQARAVPNLVPGANGKIDGFRILDVVDGSLYTKLGIKNGDIIKGVDGAPVDSPAKAMELYNSLRSKNQVQLTMERNGTTTTMTYNIH